MPQFAIRYLVVLVTNEFFPFVAKKHNFSSNLVADRDFFYCHYFFAWSSSSATTKASGQGQNEATLPKLTLAMKFPEN